MKEPVPLHSPSVQDGSNCSGWRGFPLFLVIFDAGVLLLSEAAEGVVPEVPVPTIVLDAVITSVVELSNSSDGEVATARTVRRGKVESTSPSR